MNLGKRKSKGSLWLACLLSLFLMACSKKDVVSLESVSPDGKNKVRLVELPVFDRNFQVHLIQQGVSTNIIYSSPDEGRPVGTERVVWSKDSDYFVLVGKHFTVTKEYKRPNGEQLYLLYQLSAKKLWSNALQANHAKFTSAELAGIVFTENLGEVGEVRK